jgi:hypothetical protein
VATASGAAIAHALLAMLGRDRPQVLPIQLLLPDQDGAATIAANIT